MVWRREVDVQDVVGLAFVCICELFTRTKWRAALHETCLSCPATVCGATYSIYGLAVVSTELHGVVSSAVEDGDCTISRGVQVVRVRAAKLAWQSISCIVRHRCRYWHLQYFHSASDHYYVTLQVCTDIYYVSVHRYATFILFSPCIKLYALTSCQQRSHAYCVTQPAACAPDSAENEVGASRDGGSSNLRR